MAGSEKFVAWLFECPECFPYATKIGYQSCVVAKHDGEGFPRLGDEKTRQSKVTELATWLGIEPKEIRLSWTPWGVDGVVVLERPTLIPFSTPHGMEQASIEIYQRCLLSREEIKQQWAALLEKMKQRENRGLK